MIKNNYFTHVAIEGSQTDFSMRERLQRFNIGGMYICLQGKPYANHEATHFAAKHMVTFAGGKYAGSVEARYFGNSTQDYARGMDQGMLDKMIKLTNKRFTSSNDRGDDFKEKYGTKVWTAAQLGAANTFIVCDRTDPQALKNAFRGAILDADALGTNRGSINRFRIGAGPKKDECILNHTVGGTQFIAKDYFAFDFKVLSRGQDRLINNAIVRHMVGAADIGEMLP